MTREYSKTEHTPRLEGQRFVRNYLPAVVASSPVADVLDPLYTIPSSAIGSSPLPGVKMKMSEYRMLQSLSDEAEPLLLDVILGRGTKGRRRTMHSSVSTPSNALRRSHTL